MKRLLDCGCFFLLFLLLGCTQPPAAGTPSRIPPGPTLVAQTAIPASTEILSPTAADTPVPTATLTPTVTQTATETLTPSPIPTYVTLRGKVMAEQLACRFGPGAMYLFKYSVFQDTVLEIIGRMELSSWILVQAVGGSNPCWVNGEYIEVRGDILTVAPTDPHQVLAWSPYYEALSGVSAARDGNLVTVFWEPLALREGDSAEQVPYVVEAWVCQAGGIVFAPVGAFSTAAEVLDESGCSQPSYARVFGAEKHGYTQWRVVPWPSASPQETPTP